MSTSDGQNELRIVDAQIYDVWGVRPLLVNLAEPFEEVVARNPDLHIEQTATGEVVFMPPTGGEGGYRNSNLTSQLYRWSESYGGRVFDSSTLFELPSGAKRSPDAAWISAERWSALTKEQRKGYPPICPDFVIELRSETDRLVDLQDKMREYVENGLRLGWLIDPLLKRIHVFRAGCEVKIESMPEKLPADETLPGFVLDCQALWVDA